MRMLSQRAGITFINLRSTSSGCCAVGEAGAVGDAEHMRIDGDGRFAEGGVEHHIRRLAPDARQAFELFARSAALRRDIFRPVFSKAR